MSARKTTQTFTSRRQNTRKSLRKLIAESLEKRLLFAVDSITDSVVSSDVGLYSTQIIDLPRIELAFSAELSQIEQMSDESEDVFLDYGLQSIPINANAVASITVSDPSIFSQMPEADGGFVHFRLTGKAGFLGSSLVLVETGSTRQAIEISLNNSYGAASEVDEPELWSHEQNRLFAESEGTGSGSDSLLVLQNEDTSAEEPHKIFAELTDTVGGFIVNRGTGWSGGNVDIKFEGVAKYKKTNFSGPGDYSVGGVVDESQYDSAKILTLNIPAGTGNFVVPITALQDGIEPGQFDAPAPVGDEELESESISISWANPSAFRTGTAQATIEDEDERVQLEADPATTSELGPPDGKYHFKPTRNDRTFAPNIMINWDIKYPTGLNSQDIAMLGGNEDFTVNDDDPSLWSFTTIPDDFERSNPRNVGGFQDFVMRVIANNDGKLEGTETVKVRAYISALEPIYPDPNNEDTRAYTTIEDITITEDYRDARTEKDEKAGCTCTCVSCTDGNSIDASPLDAQLKVRTADGAVLVTTSGQDGVRPVTYVGLELPSGKAIPETIVAHIDVVEKRVDEQGNLIGLGRKAIEPDAAVSNLVTFQVPAGAVAGKFIWFALEVNLASFVENWSGASGGDGISTKIVPLELIANAKFATSVPTENRFSGWVGHVSHVLRNNLTSDLHPDIGGGVSSGVDRLIKNTELMVPDVPTGGGPTSGKVKYEPGSMLVSSQGTSWLKMDRDRLPKAAIYCRAIN